VARASKVEYCMLCGDTPCSCNTKPTTRKGKPRLRKAAAQESAGSEATPRESPAPSPRRAQPTDERLVEIAAIRALAPILHQDELARYSGVLASPATVRERSAVWKARRVDELARSTEVPREAVTASQ
jgi:hypothetical protein